jgi:hypothetical protein
MTRAIRGWCMCGPRDRVRNGDRPSHCYRCGGTIPQQPVPTPR